MGEVPVAKAGALCRQISGQISEGSGVLRWENTKDTGKKSGALSIRTYTQGIIGHPTLLQHCLKLR